MGLTRKCKERQRDPGDANGRRRRQNEKSRDGTVAAFARNERDTGSYREVIGNDRRLKQWRG